MPTPELPLPLGLDPCTAPEEYSAAVYQAIGKFIVSYAQAEVSLSMTIDQFLQRRMFKSRYSREGMQVLAALSGGIRMEKLRTLVRELAKRLDSEPSDVELIDAASHQLGNLAEFRNRIGHYGAFPMGKEGRWCIQTSNKYNVRDYEKREMWRYSIEAVEAAADDCLRSTFRISHALFIEDREVLAKNAIGYDPLAAFTFSMKMIERENMP